MALNQSTRNANDGIAYLQIADGALDQVTSMLHRMVTLATQAATGTVDASGRSALDAEFKQLQSEISRIGADTNFNSRITFASGTDASLSVFVGDITQNTSFITISVGSITVTSSANALTASNTATSALNALKTDLNEIAKQRGTIGAAIRDANMAEEITAMTKYQIMAQTGIAALAQANANSQNVLGLLR